MHKLTQISPALLIALYLFYPLSLLLPCELVISDPNGYAVLLLLLCTALTYLAAHREFGRVGEHLIALSLPLSMEHPKERRAIAAHGQEIVRREHTFMARATRMIGFIQQQSASRQFPNTEV